MSDLDQSLGPFADGFAVQIGDAIFGDDIADQAARSHDARAGTEHGHDA